MGLQGRRRVLRDLSLAGETDGISYQDKDGSWHEEVARGDDRPATHVTDAPAEKA